MPKNNSAVRKQQRREKAQARVEETRGLASSYDPHPENDPSALALLDAIFRDPGSSNGWGIGDRRLLGRVTEDVIDAPENIYDLPIKK